MSKYTITITGPEGTEIHEGSGFLLFLQKLSDEPKSVGRTSVIGEHFNDALLPEAIAGDPKLLQLAFSAAGLAMGRFFAPPDKEMLEKLIREMMSKDDE